MVGKMVEMSAIKVKDAPHGFVGIGDVLIGGVVLVVGNMSMCAKSGAGGAIIPMDTTVVEHIKEAVSMVSMGKVVPNVTLHVLSGIGPLDHVMGLVSCALHQNAQR